MSDQIPTLATPIKMATGLALCEVCKSIVRTSGTDEPIVVCNICAEDMHREFMNEEPTPTEDMEELR